MKARDVTLIAVYTALLIGAQFALSFAAGVEVVSVLLACFCAAFGVKRGVITAVAFSLLRCIVFGAFPTVIILYLIYYPLYALVCAFCGKLKGWLRYGVTLAAVAVMTVLFTLLDDVITPLFYGYVAEAWTGYFIASLPTMLVHTVCVVGTTALLFPPLVTLFEKLKLSYDG